MPLRTLAFAILSLAAVAATAQTTYDRVLIPVAVHQAPGAFNSSWTSEFWAHNPNAFAVDLRLPPLCVPICILPPLQAHDTLELTTLFEPAGDPGLVLYVQQPSDNVWFFSRVYDESRQSQTFGTEVPVVREQQFYQRPFYLLGIPTASQFRVFLRIYDLDAGTDDVVTVRAFDAFSERPSFGSIDFTLSAPTAAPKLVGTTKPSYAAVQDIVHVFPGMLDSTGKPVTSAFNLEITPKTPGLKIWAFASITHNDTQHVTTITPQ